MNFKHHLMALAGLFILLNGLTAIHHLVSVFTQIPLSAYHSLGPITLSALILGFCTLPLYTLTAALTLYFYIKKDITKLKVFALMSVVTYALYLILMFGFFTSTIQAVLENENTKSSMQLEKAIKSF